MSRFPKLTTVVRSAAVALSLGGAALAAAPALAAPPPPHIDLHFGFGGGGISIGSGRYCLSDRQVRVFLRFQGYRAIRFFDRRGRIVGVRAERHGRDYRVWVDTCRARIVDVERIHRSGPGPFPGRGPFPGPFPGPRPY